MARQSDDSNDVERRLHESMEKAVREDIRRGLRTLLETKHLYQSVMVEWNAMISEADQWQKKVQDESRYVEVGGEKIWLSNGLAPYLKKYGARFSAAAWTLIPELQATNKGHNGSSDWKVVAPPAELFCRECKTTKTHNSGSLKIETSCPPYPIGSVTEQVFCCGYECQNCRIPPIVYQITRRGEKLTVTGCSDYPKVAVAKEFPDETRDYISEAKIAAGTGRLLAGLFFLRTAVEQHMRKVTDLSGRLTGDELAAAYHHYLAAEFPKHEWGLGRIYDELSAKLHSADADAPQFDKTLGELGRYFRVLELYPLLKTPTPRVAPSK